MKLGVQLAVAGGVIGLVEQVFGAQRVDVGADVLVLRGDAVIVQFAEVLFDIG